MTFDPPVFFLVFIIVVRFTAFQGGFADTLTVVLFDGGAEMLGHDTAGVIPPCKERIVHH